MVLDVSRSQTHLRILHDSSPFLCLSVAEDLISSYSWHISVFYTFGKSLLIIRQRHLLPLNNGLMVRYNILHVLVFGCVPDSYLPSYAF